MNEDLELKINGLEHEIYSAQQSLEKAEGRVKALKEELEKLKEMKKVPMLYWKIGAGNEIVRYVKHSDEFIEFETRNYRYRYIRSYTTGDTVYPRKHGVSVVVNAKDIFQKKSVLTKEWVDLKEVDHIELLEGVDVYDKA